MRLSSYLRKSSCAASAEARLDPTGRVQLKPCVLTTFLMGFTAAFYSAGHRQSGTSLTMPRGAGLAGGKANVNTQQAAPKAPVAARQLSRPCDEELHAPVVTQDSNKIHQGSRGSLKIKPVLGAQSTRIIDITQKKNPCLVNSPVPNPRSLLLPLSPLPACRCPTF